ncbi:pentatricopeptide repeat-containing protein At4g16390, chloroplastic-like [Mangifera indica]|uniref:pentatricopeptide repeat-containing protein At4g16390, chloroplastic-like n=1 Tax=Mangifera indica TaxID=29780 RepID=UPI001CFBCF6D|nr:pentatricopeptide repeat-containing protein At4g16390, chloroplastic-like [Mangifera indica]
MAYNLFHSMSSVFLDRQPLLNFSLTSNLKPKPFTFTFHSKPSLQKLHVSLQETPNPNLTKDGSSSNSYIWVNPRSLRASKLKKKSYHSRYTSLVKVAEALNVCSANEDSVFSILSCLSDGILEQDCVIIINNMSNVDTALLALKYFQNKLRRISREVILYNVTLKVLKKGRDLDKAEKLFEEMLERGIKPDNVTISTLIGCARMCSLPGKAVELFERMPSYGCEPDDVTFSAMIDAYGRAGNVDIALSLYDRARNEKWRIDSMTFSTLINIYGTTGNFDGCLNVYEEMKTLGIKPNIVVYNNLLDAMGRAKRPWQAKNIYKNMTTNGYLPNWNTYASLLRAFGRARYGEDALAVYREMKDKGLELNVTLYNTILAMCADIGYTDEAFKIFEDMKSSGTCKPNSWTFSSLITICSCSGKVSEAEAMLNEMLEAGFEPNIFILTSLIQCYGKAQHIDDVVRTFNQMTDLSIKPDDRFCGCLLNVMTQTPKEDLAKLTECIEKANPKLGNVVKLLLEEQGSEGDFKMEASELLNSISHDVRKAYLNCLIDLCVNLNLLEKACELLGVGLILEIYTDMQSRSPTQWSLHLKSLSLGAALTALYVWINDLSRALESGEEFPPLLGINTGHGKHKYSDKGLATVFESHLKELNAPFHEAPDKVGWFLTTEDAAKSWLKSRHSPELVIA